MRDWPDDPWADDARCPSCGHHAGRGCGCTCCHPKMFDATRPTLYQKCQTCGLHYRTWTPCTSGRSSSGTTEGTAPMSATIRRGLIYVGLILLTEPLLARANPHQPLLAVGEGVIGSWFVAWGMVRDGV